MLFDEPDTHQTPPTSPPHHHPPRHYSNRSLSCSPPASFPSRESSMEPSSEDSSPEGRKRHHSEPAFIWPHDVDRGLTHGFSALLAETSPLAPYRIQQHTKVQAQEKISTHKWLLSRPFDTNTVKLASKLTHFKTTVYTNRIGCFQDHLRHTWQIIPSNWLLSRPSHLNHIVVQPPGTVFDFFQDHLGGGGEQWKSDTRIYLRTICEKQRRQTTEDTRTDSSIIIICTIECLFGHF